MAEPKLPVLQKPPGYRDPNVSIKKDQKLPVRRPLPPSFRPKRKRKSCCRICCCCFCLFLIILIILILISGGLFYLWFNPKLPVFHLQSFKFQRFNVTAKSDGTYLDSQTVVRVEAKNPNGKITLNYGESQVKLRIGERTELGSASHPGFNQGKQNTTSLTFATEVKNALVNDGLMAKLKNGYRSREVVVFAEVRTSIGLGVERWRTGMVVVNVLCGEVTLKKLDDGDMPKCRINMLKWINIR